MIAEVRLPRPGAVARGKEAGEMYDEDRAGALAYAFNLVADL